MQTNQARTSTTTKTAGMKKLDECLKGELAAAETYDQAIKGVTHVGVRHTLQEILASHLQRASKLRDRIIQMGGEPSTSSGIWGAFAKAIQAGADLLGDRTAIAALEDGEDRGLKLYTEGMVDLDDKTRRLMETEFLPQQQHTHELCRSLKTYVNAAS